MSLYFIITFFSHFPDQSIFIHTNNKIQRIIKLEQKNKPQKKMLVLFQFSNCTNI